MVLVVVCVAWFVWFALLAVSFGRCYVLLLISLVIVLVVVVWLGLFSSLLVLFCGCGVLVVAVLLVFAVVTCYLFWVDCCVSTVRL